MSKTYFILLFFVGFFAGITLGLFWGVPLGVRDTTDSLKRLEAKQSVLQTDATTIKEILRSPNPAPSVTP